jgi:hypothetical protein
MSDNRQDIVNNANNFFARALSSGLDFRMGVTNVCDPEGSCKEAVGKLCSDAPDKMGGPDRFLLPSEQSIFSECIKDPPCSEPASEYGLVNALQAVKKHLPRSAKAMDKIRSQAKLVLIIATDELPQELKDHYGGYSYNAIDTCMLAAADQTKVNAFIQPYLELFKGISDPEGAAMVHLIGGVCSSSCSSKPEIGHGYIELAQQLGGQMGDVCQKDLGNTLQVIIDSIVAGASPLKLEYVPISSSLAVAMDNKMIPRGRTSGFDYRTTAEGPVLVFIDVRYQKGSEIIASYKRWRQEPTID